MNPPTKYFEKIYLYKGPLGSFAVKDGHIGQAVT